MHLKMINAIQTAYPLNIIVGMHQGTWDLYSNYKKINKLSVSGDVLPVTDDFAKLDVLNPVT